MQLPLFDTQSTWEPPTMASLPQWAGCARVGIDVETYDPHLKETGPSVRTGGFLAGISFALEDGPAFYLPIRHQGGGNLPVDAVLLYLRQQANKYPGVVVGHNLSYDLDWLAEAGITFRHVANLRDTMIADPLLDELHDSYSLDAVAKRWGYPGKNMELLDAALRNYGLTKGEMWRLHSKYVGPYATEDARLPLLINRKQERAIEAQDLWPIYDLESAVQPALLEMRRHGVRVDLDALAKVEKWALHEEELALSQVRLLTGISIPVNGVWAKAPVVKALTAAGIKLGTTPTGQPQVDKTLLAASTHPVAAHVLRARDVNKLRTTFVESVRTHLVGDRLHPTYNQLATTRETGDTVGARYGRMSVEHPNLQQQPIRKQFGAMWRGIYIPDAGARWLCADYNQQEPRLITHYAELLGLPGAVAMAERYRSDPMADNHSMMTQLVYGQAQWDAWTATERKPHRDKCKNIYLGLCYGMGGGRLAEMLDLPTEWTTNAEGRTIKIAGPEAQALLDQFNTRVPYVRALAQHCTRRAEDRGFVRTLLGRKCRFPVKPSGGYDWAHKALNRVIQGSAADQLKRAMVELHRVGLTPQLPVHDELDMSIYEDRTAQRVMEVMRDCVQLTVPSRVDLEIGTSWGAIK